MNEDVQNVLKMHVGATKLTSTGLMTVYELWPW